MEDNERQVANEEYPNEEFVFQTENGLKDSDINNGLSDEKLLKQAEKFLENNDLVEAQRKLESVREKNGCWHYIQGRVYLQMSWHNEAKKQFELAVADEPKNKTYKKALKRIKNFDGKSFLLNQSGNDTDKEGACMGACCECSGEVCCLGICEGICNGL